MAPHARPGRNFLDMLELILANQRRPNDPFSPQLLMAIFWEEGFFTNKTQQHGSAIGFGQVEPAELPKLTTAQARANGYEVPGVSAATRQLSDPLAVTVPSCMLLHLFHSAPANLNTEEKVTWALHGYGGVGYKGKSSLTREQRLAIIAGWRNCEEKLKALPFDVYHIVNYPGRIADLEDGYMDALALARPFVRDFIFGRAPRVRFRDLLFPRYWFVGFTPREDFHVVAAPGETLPSLRHGDVLVAQPRNGGAPFAGRVTSAPAPAEHFFFEGVSAESSAPGLYVSIETAGAPIAQRVADSHGHVARGLTVLRAAAHPYSLTEEYGEATEAELRRERDRLIAKISKSDLYWHTIPLVDGYKILVSSPLLIDGMFLPGTPREALDLARRFEVFPLTRAVMDHTHNAAIQLEYPGPPSTLFDFIGYTTKLKKTAYYTQYGYALASGAHKLWVLSSYAPVVNYGLYIKRKRDDVVRPGTRLDHQWKVIQSLGGKHNMAWWDYSQLLQFMTRLVDADGQDVDLRQALLAKHKAVWDEDQPPSASHLP